MHTPAIFLFAAMATAAQAAEQPSPVSPPAAPAGQQQPLPTYLDYYHNLLSGLMVLNGILANVKDKESADQSAEFAFAIYENINEIPRSAALKHTSEEEQRRVDALYSAAKQAFTQNLQQHIRNIVLHKNYSSDHMGELIDKLAESDWAADHPSDSSGLQTNPAKLQSAEQEMSSFLDQTLEQIENINTLLQTVHNTVSADLAAEKLAAFMQQTEARRDQLSEKHAQTPPNMVERIIQSRMQRIESGKAATKAVQKKLEQQNYYGSQTLKKALLKFAYRF
ncbi:hypothetical protein [Akkermansia glycaniphila]|uniref:Uncharacterized protein n=1 Tax=Akkermansia glycaniphila TaxID=1679444 RepID=A0A1C7PAK6_9BACT|nr:hypothetical protein [Akkermansia glycaniphila]OCA02489.1 hypothetical protein AC781_09775 [Akkermansia glycaniphila]SEH90065.1 Hypothetical protein PYTT_1559 [Akkermansia glycaniphila]